MCDLVLLVLEFRILLLDDLLEAGEGLVGLAVLCDHLLLDRFLEFDVEPLEFARERRVALGGLAALEFLLLLE